MPLGEARFLRACCARPSGWTCRWRSWRRRAGATSSATSPACARPAPRSRRACRWPTASTRMQARQAGGRAGRGRAPAARRPAPVRRGDRAGHHPRRGGGAGRGGAAVSALELRLHRHPGPVRPAPAVHLLHRAAGPGLVAGGAGRLRPRRGGPAVHPVHEVWPGHFLQFLHSNRAESELGAAVRRLRLRRGVGALLPRR